MKTEKVTFNTKMIIPRAWEHLLKIENFENLTPYPEERGVKNILVGDPIPFRDDRRELSIHNGNFGIILVFESNNEAYWANYEIWKDGDCLYCSGKPMFEITTGLNEIKVHRDEEELVFIFDVAFEPAKDLKILANFLPQYWDGPNTSPAGPEVEIDVTDRILKMSAADIKAIRDGQMEADALVAGLYNHNGPFHVTVRHAIEEFLQHFGVQELRDITDEKMLEIRDEVASWVDMDTASHEVSKAALLQLLSHPEINFLLDFPETSLEEVSIRMPLSAQLKESRETSDIWVINGGEIRFINKETELTIFGAGRDHKRWLKEEGTPYIEGQAYEDLECALIKIGDFSRTIQVPKGEQPKLPAAIEVSMGTTPSSRKTIMVGIFEMRDALGTQIATALAKSGIALMGVRLEMDIRDSVLIDDNWGFSLGDIRIINDATGVPEAVFQSPDLGAGPGFAATIHKEIYDRLANSIFDLIKQYEPQMFPEGEKPDLPATVAFLVQEIHNSKPKGNCVACGSANLDWYDGLLGYESVVCKDCNHDQKDSLGFTLTTNQDGSFLWIGEDKAYAALCSPETQKLRAGQAAEIAKAVHFYNQARPLLNDVLHFINRCGDGGMDCEGLVEKLQSLLASEAPPVKASEPSPVIKKKDASFDIKVYSTEELWNKGEPDDEAWDYFSKDDAINDIGRFLVDAPYQVVVVARGKDNEYEEGEYVYKAYDRPE